MSTKAVIKSSVMEGDMLDFVIAKAAYALYQSDDFEKAAHFLRSELTKEYHKTWHCVVGREFASYVTHLEHCYVYFYLGQLVMSVESPVSFARGLSDPLQPNRLKALKAFGEWMDKNGAKYEFSCKEVDQVWRALQLTLWMADKRPVQQQVAAECVLFARKISPALLPDWNRGFWYNIERIYETIDKFRVPKFHLLIRIYVSELFHQMHAREFDPAFVHSMMQGITANVDKAVGAYIQLVCVFLPELQTELGNIAFAEAIPTEAFIALLDPALQVISSAAARPLSLITRTVENIFTRAEVLNYSPEVCALIKTRVKTAAMAKNLEQETRDVLFSCLDQIDQTPCTVPVKVKKTIKKSAK